VDENALNDIPGQQSEDAAGTFDENSCTAPQLTVKLNRQ
jgi:hypothetical protein